MAKKDEAYEIMVGRSPQSEVGKMIVKGDLEGAAINAIERFRGK